MAQINKPNQYFNTKLYTGNGSTNNITGIGFQPDWTWIKYRNSGTYGHDLYDAVRGATKTLNTNNTNAEYTSANRLTSFTSDGFNLGSGASTNENSGTFASWNWKESATSGFDIVQFESDGSGIATVSHNLNAIPKFIITKNIDVSDSWQCYHNSLGNTGFITLNTTSASGTTSTFWNSTTPTSSNFQVSKTNLGSGTIICYVFAEKKGYSKFGSYTGNGNADGTFVYTGQKSAFIMLKNTTRAASWLMFDNKRLGYNVDNNELVANTSAAEETYDELDILSNGFKMRANGTSTNLNGDTYIYMAFAENPLVGTNNIPATAR